MNNTEMPISLTEIGKVIPDRQNQASNYRSSQDLYVSLHIFYLEFLLIWMATTMKLFHNKGRVPNEVLGLPQAHSEVQRTPTETEEQQWEIHWRSSVEIDLDSLFPTLILE